MASTWLGGVALPMNRGDVSAADGLIVDRIADGKVRERWEQWEQWDQSLMLQQLGFA